MALKVKARVYLCGMGKFSTIFKSSILAGICIGIAGFGYLALGGVVGGME